PFLCSLSPSRGGHPRDHPSFPTRRSSDLRGTTRWSIEHACCNRADRHDLADRHGRIRHAVAECCSALRRAVVEIRLCRCSGKHTDRKSTRLNSSHVKISYAVFCFKKKTTN